MKRIGTALAVSVCLAALYGVALCDEADASKVADGKPVFVKYKCGSCHSIEVQGIKKKAVAATGSQAPDLSGVGVERTSEWLASFLSKKEKLDGKLHMKKFSGTPAELKKLSGWLATLKDEAAAKNMKAVEAKNAASKAPEAATPAEKSETKSGK
ncbi:MAG TPA: c-type cytochrome [Candidatus Limnocylindrales bacterium]|nr:c-type cytochrome [Candidatus Limnocylindrales bacterium]